MYNCNIDNNFRKHRNIENSRVRKFVFFIITHQLKHKYSWLVDDIIISGCEVQVVTNPNPLNQHIQKSRLVEPKNALADDPLGVSIELILTSQ